MTVTDETGPYVADDDFQTLRQALRRMPTPEPRAGFVERALARAAAQQRTEQASLPARLRLDETFETWVPVAEVPDVPNVERLGRVLLSSGKIVKSQRNNTVPPVGNVAGPGSR